MKQTINKIIRSKEYQELKKMILTYFYILLRDKFYEWKTGIQRSGVLLVADDRDYPSDDFIVAGASTKAIDLRDRFTIQNQLTAKTSGMIKCGPFSGSMGADVGGAELSINWLNGDLFGEYMRDNGMFHSYGSYLMDIPKALKMRGLISAYYRVDTLEQAEKVLNAFRPILIGTGQMYYNNDIGEYVPGKAPGHLMLMIGYDSEYIFIADPWQGRYTKTKRSNWSLFFPSRIALEFDRKYLLIEEMVAELRERKLPQSVKIYEYLVKKYKVGKKDRHLVSLAMRSYYKMDIPDYMKL